MIALSIHLPDPLAKASQQAAEELGISRTQFIRQALIHELESYETQRERTAMAKSFKKMSKNTHYLKELSSIDNDLSDALPDDKEAWWTGKK